MARTSTVELPRLVAAAARRLLADGGPRSVTHRAVAAEAGVATKSVANRFGSIGDLLDYVALRGFRELEEVVFGDGGRRLDRVGAEAGRVERAMARYRRWALANPELHRLMFDAPALGITPSAATRRAAAELVALFAAAGPSRTEGRRRFVQMHGEVQLALSGLALPGPAFSAADRGP